MPKLSVHLTEVEHTALKRYALENNTSMSKALKNAFFQILEDQYDLEAFDKAYVAYRKNPKAYSGDMVAKELGID